LVVVFALFVFMLVLLCSSVQFSAVNVP